MSSHIKFLHEHSVRTDRKEKRSRIGEDDVGGIEKIRKGFTTPQFLSGSKMERWLTAHIGRDWDEIFAQFCKLTPPHESAHHIADSHVLMHTFMQDGEVHFNKSSMHFPVASGIVGRIRDLTRNTLYVHPETKVLMQHTSRKTVTPVKERVRYLKKGDAAYMMHDGVWCEIRFRPLLKSTAPAEMVHDHICGSVTALELFLLRGEKKVAENLLPLNGRQLKALGLANGKVELESRGRYLDRNLEYDPNNGTEPLDFFNQLMKRIGCVRWNQTPSAFVSGMTRSPGPVGSAAELPSFHQQQAIDLFNRSKH